MVIMRPIPELKLGYNDAENYRRKDEKALFNSLFVKTPHLERLCDARTYFLIGDKGTGKTAYAVYLANNFQCNTFAYLSYIRETDYQKFVSLKRERHLVLSDYVDIWSVIILLLLSQRIKEKEKSSPITGKISRINKFRNINKAVEEYYSNAFSPEIQHALIFVERSKIAAELLSKHLSADTETSKEQTFSEIRFQTNLLYIRKKFEEALTSINLKDSHLLFIDGIDIRPASMLYDDYLECIKGLANAVWALNNDFFANIKGSAGRLRVVLLIRPDIFNSLGLQNQNTKIRDNAVLLDWQTTYPMYRESAIFSIADRLLCSQQSTSLQFGDAWDYYFPYKITEVFQPSPKQPTKREKTKNPLIQMLELKYGTEQITPEPTEVAVPIKIERDSFISFLRFSLYRPRDIITMLKILQQQFIQKNRHPSDVFRLADFNNSEFRRIYADYLTGEIKDSLSFYHTPKEYELFLKFFEYLEGKHEFNYDQYVQAYNKLIAFLDANSISKPTFFQSADTFLQFLYELNVICYLDVTEDGESWIRWCFRERSNANIAPKVKTHTTYMIHYGMWKGFNIGKTLRHR